MKILDSFKSHDHGKILSDQIFSNETFSDFNLRPPFNHAFTIRNVRFENCKVTPGTCVIGAGTILDNVVFENIQCGDAMHIAAEVFMKNVVVEGVGRPSMLWIRPSVSADSASLSNGDEICTLDVSKYIGELSITGIDIGRVKINPELHIKIYLEKMNKADWKSLGISGLSYWRLMAKKISSDGAGEGIFSLPSRRSRNYEKSIFELDILKGAAIV